MTGFIGEIPFYSEQKVASARSEGPVRLSAVSNAGSQSILGPGRGAGKCLMFLLFTQQTLFSVAVMSIGCGAVSCLQGCDAEGNNIQAENGFLRKGGKHPMPLLCL